MEARARAKALVPVVGSLTALVTGTGALALAHVAAPAGAEATTTGVAGAATAPTGALQGCEAYFGFGKDEGGLNLVAFDVHDQNGDDGVDHAVPDDTEVVLVLHYADGDVECTPFGVDEETWLSEFGPNPNLPYPGADHYVYPSVNLAQDDEDGELGELEGVGFRVTSYPGGEHTLVSPIEEVALPDYQLNDEDLFFTDLDPRVTDAIAEGVDEDAADAFADAYGACDSPFQGEIPDDLGTDDDVLAASNFLLDLIGEDENLESVNCQDVSFLNADASEVLGVQEAAAQVQPIVLSLPEAPTPEPTEPGAPATPVVNDIAFTG